MRWDLWFLPDSACYGKLQPGGEVLRGKAAFYRDLREQGLVDRHYEENAGLTAAGKVLLAA